MEDVENKIRDISGLVTNAAFNAKNGEVKNKIPTISGLVTNTALNAKIDQIGRNT